MEITLQQLLNAIADGGDLAALLRQYTESGELSAERIAELRTEAQAAFVQIQDSEELSHDDIPRLRSIADTVTALEAEATHLTQQAEATAAEVAELARAAGVSSEDTTTPADGEDGDAEGEDGDAPADDGADGGTEGGGTEGDPDNSDSGLTAQEIIDAPVVDTTQPEPIAASARPRARVNLSQLSSRVPRPRGDQLPAEDGADLPFGGTLVASMEAPGMRGGSTYASWLDVAQAAAKSFNASPSSLLASVADAERSGGRFYQRNGLLEMRKQFPEELIMTGMDGADALKAAVDQSRLPNGSLLAAGGWCSPSEQLYDLCDLPCTLEGILSIPEVLASRGGIKWIRSLDWCDIFNAPGFFHFTEAQMQAEPRPDKPCMEIPCPEEDECRLDVDGLCITADIMMSRTMPELISQFIQGAMCAHAHRINANVISQIVAGSPSIGTITQAGYGATASILYAIEMQIQAYRYRGRRAQEGNAALLELVAPYWIKAVIRADLANRPGYPESALAVTDAMIVNWFASRGVAVRFVYDWQDLTGCPVPPATTVDPITDYPNTVEFILYEAGTWVKPSLDVITLETLYDSALIKQNKYTALFTEEAFCVINRCNDSIRFTVPVCANGNVGDNVAVVCAADVP